MGNNQSKMDALNSQMNTLVETQAQEIDTLKKQVQDRDINYNLMLEKSLLIGGDYEKEIKFLNEENDTLKAELQNITTSDATTEAPYGFHPSGSPRSKPLAEFQSDIITSMKKGIEELKQEISHKNKKFGEWCEENRELKEEVNDLKTDRDTMLETCGDLDYMEECVGYVNELKQEVEMKKDAWDGEKVCKDLIENTKYTPETTFIEYIQKLEKDIDALSKMNDKKHKYHKNKCEEVKKLKKAMCELGTQNQYHKNGWEVFGCQSKKDLDEENKKLKKENEKQEDILVSIQDELLGEVFEPSFHKLLPKIKSLKEDYDKNWAAMECLSFMDYKYKNGTWANQEEVFLKVD
jgi:cell division protein FtsL